MRASAEFVPPRWLAGPHLQTVVPALWPARAPRGKTERLVVDVADGSAVGLRIDRPEGAPRATVVLVHGMCGSSESGYLRRTARQAVARGWTAVRMNLRNCGGTERLATTLYNAGQSDDLGRVLEALDAEGMPRPLCVAGFSLGGNLALRYAGRAGDASRADAVAAVNPPIDLDACARAIELPRNRLYQAYYTRALCAQLRRVARVRPLPGPPPRARHVRSVRRFDALYTAPDAGHASAEAYYAAASAGPFLGGLGRPAMLLSAADDPFVPLEIFRPHRAVPGLRLLHPARGGHCGYWQRGSPRDWAAAVLLDFFGELGGRG